MLNTPSSSSSPSNTPTTTSSPQYCSDNEELEKALVNGNEAFSRKDYESALQLYEKALLLYQEHVNNHQGIAPMASPSFVATTLSSIVQYKIGLAYFYLERWEEAIPFFEKAIDYDPTGYANACTMLFNLLWKINSCVQAIITVHDFLNRFPKKEQAIQPILNNLKNSKHWYMDPRIRIVKLTEDNYCVQAVDDIPVEETIQVFDEDGHREEVKGVTIVKDSLLCTDQFITGTCTSDEETMVTMGITIKHLIQNYKKFQNVLRGLHPRKIEQAPVKFVEDWKKFFFEQLKLVKQNLGVREEFENLSLEEIEHLESDPQRLEEVLRMTMVIKLNGFVGGVYGLACMFNHSCEENCEKIDEKIVTTKNIKKGDYLCLNYMGFDDKLANRRKYLLEHFAFECECPRCQREIMAGESLIVDPEDDIMEDEEEIVVTEHDVQ
ncbi:hypothetical protein FDP41_002025 [Naegleria fowleri]|uniref:SET domain-containing protein n=1 Tax=Naegleria fowleri TaxID=5763 RepID=A0A6A5C080_NAEFO|nr:uncharacterized protein FDP41_002025 [Naegleria fowleri]KAF0978955.1 hypothetical protein FDP41_002025 [Naegleria fowleri]